MLVLGHYAQHFEKKCLGRPSIGSNVRTLENLTPKNQNTWVAFPIFNAYFFQEANQFVQIIKILAIQILIKNLGNYVSSVSRTHTVPPCELIQTLFTLFSLFLLMVTHS